MTHDEWLMTKKDHLEKVDTVTEVYKEVLRRKEWNWNSLGAIVFHPSKQFGRGWRVPELSMVWRHKTLIIVYSSNNSTNGLKRIYNNLFCMVFFYWCYFDYFIHSLIVARCYIPCGQTYATINQGDYYLHVLNLVFLKNAEYSRYLIYISGNIDYTLP